MPTYHVYIHKISCLARGAVPQTIIKINLCTPFGPLYYVMHPCVYTVFVCIYTLHNRNSLQKNKLSTVAPPPHSSDFFFFGLCVSVSVCMALPMYIYMRVCVRGYFSSI